MSLPYWQKQRRLFAKSVRNKSGQVNWIQATCRSVNADVSTLFFFLPLFLELTCALLERDAGAHLDVVDPDVSPGAVREKALHHHLGEGEEGRKGRSRQEEDKK